MHSLVSTVIIATFLTGAPMARAENAAPTGAMLPVNHEAITSSQIIDANITTLNKWAAQLDQPAFVYKATPMLAAKTQNAIHSLLLYHHTQRSLENVDHADQIIEAAMAKQRQLLLAQFGGSEARTSTELHAKGTTIDEVLEDQKRNLIVDAYREARFDPSMQISRTQLLQYYRSHREDEFTRDPNLVFQLVDIHVKPFLPKNVRRPDQQQRDAARAQAAAQAQNAWQEIQNGTDFDDIVARYSHGFRKKNNGLWARNPNSFNKHYLPIVTALNATAPGDTTGIIETPDRFFIAKLIANQPAETVPFAQAQFQIAEKIRRQRWKKFIGKLTLELQQNATVGDVEQFVQETAQLAYEQLGPAAN